MLLLLINVSATMSRIYKQNIFGLDIPLNLQSDSGPKTTSGEASYQSYAGIGYRAQLKCPAEIVSCCRMSVSDKSIFDTKVAVAVPARRDAILPPPAEMGMFFRAQHVGPAVKAPSEDRLLI
jgi:hypothetical protein